VTDTTSCARCGTGMPFPTGRAARKRFCSDACRKAAWRERHRNDTTTGDTVSDAVVVPTASRDDAATPGGQHRCPHCRQPLAIISVVIPADGAIVKPPEVPPMTPH